MNSVNYKYQPVVNNIIKVNVTEPIIYYPWNEVLFVKGISERKHPYFIKKYGDHYSTKTPKNILDEAKKWIEDNSDEKLAHERALFLQAKLNKAQFTKLV